MEALALVTNEKGTPYSEYVIRCKKNAIARQLKLSDLRDNASLNRVLHPEKHDSDFKRVQRYILSYKFLTDETSEAATAP